mmetsp:Transcript_12650/g.11204  ORF Transcript_12650/g.11204 Transcript_12650/m.11204 type:complete len:178 (-) Transcript_12650:45-578(-)
MGIDYTFNDSAVVFSIIGACFGASTATRIIENILWSETVFWKKILRGLIGAAVVVTIFLLTSLIPYEDHPTRYFFNHLLPHLVAAYCAFGVVPILSNYIGLVNKGSDRQGSLISHQSFNRIVEEDSNESEEDYKEEIKETPKPLEEDGKITDQLVFKRMMTHDLRGDMKKSNDPLLS